MKANVASTRPQRGALQVRFAARARVRASSESREQQRLEALLSPCGERALPRRRPQCRASVGYLPIRRFLAGGRRLIV